MSRLVRAGHAVGDAVELRVVNLPAALAARHRVDGKSALVSRDAPVGRGTLVETAMGGLVLSVVPTDEVETGCVALSELAQLNCRLSVGTVEKLRRFDARDIPLRSVLCDVRLRFVRSDVPLAHVDAAALTLALARHFFGCVVTLSELLVLEEQGCELVMRVLEVELDDDDDDGAHAHADDVDEKHAFRGRVAPTTRFYVVPTDHESGLALQNAAVRPARAPRSCVKLLSNDGEEFVIAKRVLRPCLALTHVVRGTSTELLEAAVDVDACTLDRALLFLQLFAHGETQSFEVPLGVVEDLLAAAKVLQFGVLEDHCAVLLGQAQARVRPWRWAEVEEAIAGGRLLLVIDGGIFDVTGWLDKHPGGSKIVPQQALGVDGTVFFEIYHATRESFEYLRQFYVGELLSLDELAKVPPPVAHRARGGKKRDEASTEFLDALRQVTAPWRLGQSAGWKSF